MQAGEGNPLPHNFEFVEELTKLLTKYDILEEGQYAKPFHFGCYSSKKIPLVGNLRFKIDNKP